ncbi:MAG TPA: TCP-1/cpn60 chaperonin family protein [Thermoanaerobaculia bacterium]
MPFRDPFNGYYEQIIKPSIVAAGMRPLRADEVYGTSAIMRDVWESIWRCGVAIADVTDRNPNVNYELGLCHALGVPTVLLTKRAEDVPFDYRHRRYILYNTEQAGWENKLRSDLLKTINAAQRTSVDSELPWPYEAGPQLKAAFQAVELADSRSLIVDGVRQVRQTLARAFGPRGGPIAARDAGAALLRRGVAITEAVAAANPLQERGIAEMRAIAREQMLAVGDGTKTVVLIGAKMIEIGDHLLRTGFSKELVLAGMREATRTALTLLESNRKSASQGELARVAVGAGGNSEAVRLLADAVSRLGPESDITVSEGDGDEPSLAVWDGMRIDSGYASEYFITEVENMACVLDNCYVLLADQAISSMADLLPILEAVAKRGAPLLIVAPAIEGEALATLITNKLRGTITCAAVNLPTAARDNSDYLTDLAIYCGATVAQKQLGTTIRHLSLDDLGRAGRVVADRYVTRIIAGGGHPDALAGRLRILRSEIADCQDVTLRAALRSRLLRLKASVAVLSVGGRTRLESSESRSRAQAALASCTAAAEYGVLPGGGAWLAAAANVVRTMPHADRAVVAGRELVAESLEEPLRVLIESSGGERAAFDRLRRQDLGRMDLVFDASSGIVNPLSTSVAIDAAALLRSAIELASAHADVMLQTVSWDNVLQSE